MTMRTMQWFAMVGALLAASTAVAALAETRPIAPRGSGIIQKGPDGVAKPQPDATRSKPPVEKTKPFVGGATEGTGI